MQLARNFTLAEMVQSQTAARRGIDNTPADPAIVEALRAVAVNVLQPVRDHFGGSVFVTSGYRCPQLNEAIGGSATSQHMKGRPRTSRWRGTAIWRLPNGFAKTSISTS